MSRDPVSRAAHRLLCGRLAGVLFLVGSVASLPVNRLFDPSVGDRTYAITALGAVSAALCCALPWDRVAERWLHLIPVLGTAEVALTMWGVGPHAHTYVWFLVFVVVFAAFAFESRGAIALHLAGAVTVAFYPIALVEAGMRDNRLAESIVASSILVVACAVVVHLRERLTATMAALADEVIRDPLTGVGNYRQLERRLAYEVTRHARHGRELTLVVLDLNDFKEVNDTLGHPTGDRLLREVAAILRATVRDQDTVVRQGGDEFCVLAPETSAADGEALLLRLKQAVGGLAGVSGPLSVSAGHAAFPRDAVSADGLLAHADLEQRRDKAAGRDQAGLARALR